MKRILAILLIGLTLLAAAAGCAAKSSSKAMDTARSGAAQAAPENGSVKMNDAITYSSKGGPESTPAPSAAAASKTASTGVVSPSYASISADKIIYAAAVSVETLKFDETIAAVNTMMQTYGAFIESSSVNGSNYSNKKGLRSAQYVLRVPSARFEDLKNNMGELGNVTYSSTNATNITAQYSDADSRKKMYEVEEERLLAMLAKADNVADMLKIEAQLSDVRYNIERLKSQLTNWDNQVNYSSVTLSITEVVQLTDEPTVARSYWDRIKEALSSSAKGVWNFLKNSGLFLVAALPVLLLLAAAAVIVLLATRKSRAAKRAKKLEDKKPKE